MFSMRKTTNRLMLSSFLLFASISSSLALNCQAEAECTSINGFCSLGYKFCEKGQCDCDTKKTIWTKRSDSAGGKCEPKLYFNDTCQMFPNVATRQMISLCDPDRGLECSHELGVCVCKGCTSDQPKRMGDHCRVADSRLACPGSFKFPAQSYCEHKTNKCVCQRGFAEQPNGLCAANQFGDSCMDDSECQKMDGVCKEGRCQCADGVQLIQDKDKVVKCAIGYPGNPCRTDTHKPCEQGSYCKSGSNGGDNYCQCTGDRKIVWSSHYVAHIKRVIHLPKCMEKAKLKLAGESEECTDFSSAGGRWEESVCQMGLVCGSICMEEQNQYRSVCRRLAAIGEKCDQAVCVGGASCIKGVCQCTDDYCSNTLLERMPAYEEEAKKTSKLPGQVPTTEPSRTQSVGSNDVLNGQNKSPNDGPGGEPGGNQSQMNSRAPEFPSPTKQASNTNSEESSDNDDSDKTEEQRENLDHLGATASSSKSWGFALIVPLLVSSL